MDLGGTAHRIDHTRKLRQQTVARVLNHSASVSFDLRMDQLGKMRLQSLVSAFVVRPGRSHPHRGARLRNWLADEKVSSERASGPGEAAGDS